MKHASLVFGPLAALALFAIGCNTAQVTTPPLVDAGPPCPELAPVIGTSNGGVCARGPTSGGCSGGVSLDLNAPDASNVIPDDGGGYAPYCTVGFFIQDPASPDCLRAPACECLPADAGASDGGDAGPVLPGVWQCFAQQ